MKHNTNRIRYSNPLKMLNNLLGQTFFETLKIVFYAVLISFVVRSFFFQPFTIPSGSMFPTLLIGDYIFVSKFSYGYSKYSFPLASLLGLSDRRIFKDEIKNGDVAVFRPKNQPNIDFVKRVIGLPGDRIEISADSRLKINGTDVKRLFVGEYVHKDSGGYSKKYLRYKETLPNGQSYFVLQRKGLALYGYPMVFNVPKGHYFVLGDNRDESEDSRGTVVSMIPEENFLGKAEIIFLSKDENQWLLAFWLWAESIRWERIFTKI